MTGGNATLNRPWGGPGYEKRDSKPRGFVRKPAGTNNSSNFRCSPPLLATACASLTARCAQAMTVKVNVSKEPSRRSRIANPAACVFCVLTMVVVVPNLWA